MPSVTWMRGAALATAALAFAGSTWFLVARRRPDPATARREFPAAALWGGDRREARSPDGKRVASVEDSELWVRAADGSRTQLTHDGEPKSYPAWSPDGRSIAFYRHEEVFVVSAQGGASRKVGWSLHPEGLAWTPDGKSLVLPDKDASDEPASLYSRSLETGEKRRLTSPEPGTIGDQFPALSPRADRLAFARVRRNGAADIYVRPFYDDVVRVAQPRRLTFHNRAVSSLQWTGDGRRIVYASGAPGSRTGELWMIPETGGPPKPYR